jgi:hypothetical protein
MKNWISKKYNGTEWLTLIWLRIGFVAGMRIWMCGGLRIGFLVELRV